MNMFGFGDAMELDTEKPIALIVQTTDKKVHKVTFTEEGDDTDIIFSAPYLFSQMKSCLVSGAEVVVGLTQNLRLFLNNKLFSNECTSFLLTQNFLAFVNSTAGLMHEMFMYDLNRPLPRPSLSADLSNPTSMAPKLASLSDSGSFNVRAVERGARLVLNYGFKTVLQMPRGNLEGICPRIILLKAVVQMIQNK